MYMLNTGCASTTATTTATTTETDTETDTETEISQRIKTAQDQNPEPLFSLFSSKISFSNRRLRSDQAAKSLF